MGRQVADDDGSLKPKPRAKKGFNTITLETLLGGVASVLIFLILVCILFLCLLRQKKGKTTPAPSEAQPSSTSSGTELSVYISGQGAQDSNRSQLNWTR